MKQFLDSAFFVFLNTNFHSLESFWFSEHMIKLETLPINKIRNPTLKKR